jgi:hypothetical protein
MLQFKQLERQGGIFTETVVVPGIRDDLEMQWRLCSSALYNRLQHVAEEYVGVGLAGRRRHYKARAEGLGMYVVKSSECPQD